jgi:hypothetical protein
MSQPIRSYGKPTKGEAPRRDDVGKATAPEAPTPEAVEISGTMKSEHNFNVPYSESGVNGETPISPNT